MSLYGAVIALAEISRKGKSGPRVSRYSQKYHSGTMEWGGRMAINTDEMVRANGTAAAASTRQIEAYLYYYGMNQHQERMV